MPIFVFGHNNTMDQISIHRAYPEDVETVLSIGRETFVETFAANNTPENLEQYVREHFSEAKLTAELNDPGSLFFIARDTGVPVGYLKLNSGSAQTDLQDEDAIEIERIYVKSAWHGKKIGQLLYEKALEIAGLQHKSYIWLGVWEENPKAIRFYEKNGFVSFDKHLFRMGEDEQTDILMKKIL
jgi:diamine N-acetyltransferase